MDRARRAMPVQNKACYERHVQKCQDNHRLRLAKMKPTIDCHAPSSMRKAIKTNAKKQQIMVRAPGNAKLDIQLSVGFHGLIWALEAPSCSTRVRRGAVLSCIHPRVLV